MNKKICIVTDEDFALKNEPPFPRPLFLSFENPKRIRAILEYFRNINLFADNRIIKGEPKIIDESVLELAHSKYHIESIKRLSDFGSGILSEEVYITEDTFEMAKKALGGTIGAIESVLNGDFKQSFALVRPPGHHAFRETSSGLCIFNNIANSILYLRNKCNYDKKIAIVDIDDHFGDGLVQYFYEDPNVLYFSVHEFDFLEGDIGFLNEFGEGEGLGTNINFPMPTGVGDEEFAVFFDVLEPILREYQPDLIVVAAGFDMHFSDPIGNCNLTSTSYYKFAQLVLQLADEICEGKLTFVLEGGYNVIALPYCVHAVIKALLREEYEPPIFEKLKLLDENKVQEVKKIKTTLVKLLANYWSQIN